MHLARFQVQIVQYIYIYRERFFNNDKSHRIGDLFFHIINEVAFHDLSP